MAQSGSNPSKPETGNPAASSAAALLEQAREKLEQGNAAEALVPLATVAALAGCPPALRMEAAKMLGKAGDTEAAIACYLEAGTAYLRELKDFPHARQAFQAGHALDVHNLDVIFMLGQADVAEGRQQDGLAKYIDVLRKSNLKHVPALFEAGCIYQINGQHDQSMLAFKKVLDRDKDNVQATMHIGQLFQSKENLPEAIGYYIQAAQIARECQHWGTARNIASTVLSLDPQNKKARLILDDLEEQGHTADEPVVPEAAAVPPSKPAVPAAPSRAQQAAPVKPEPPPAPYRPGVAASAGSSSAPPQAQPQPAAAEKAPPIPVVAQVAAKATPVKQAEVEAPKAPPTIVPPPVSAAPPSAPPAAASVASATTPAVPNDEVARAKQLLATTELQRQAAQADLQLLLSTREELQQALAEQRTILESAVMRKNELETQIAATRAALEQAKQSHGAAASSETADKETAAALAAERTTLEADVAALRADVAALSTQKSADQESVLELTALRDKTTAEVAALTLKMQDAKRLTDELEAAHAAVAGPNAEAAAKADALDGEVAALESRQAEAQSKLEAADAALAALEARSSQAKTQAEHADALRQQRQAEADALARRVDALNATVTDLEQRVVAPPVPPSVPSAQPNVGPLGAHMRVAAHLAAGEFDKAIEGYKRALEANPHDAAAAYQAGALLAEHGSDLEGAERLLMRAAELRPEHTATRYQLAVVKARRGNVVEGAEMLASLVRSDANNGDFVDQFVERLEKDAQGGDVGAKFRVGVAYRELGRVEEALVTLQSIQHEPEFAVQCLIAIGLCLRRQGLDGAAAKRFAKAVETPGYPEPMYLEALYNLGDLYEAKGTQESLALALSSFEELYARDCTYRDVGERVRVVRTNLTSSERQKVKRLPTRIIDSQGNQ